MAGQRWQWQMQASIARDETQTSPDWNTQDAGVQTPQVGSNWRFYGQISGQTSTSPWAYVGQYGGLQKTPYGQVVYAPWIQSDFHETISGGFTNVERFDYSTYSHTGVIQSHINNNPFNHQIRNDTHTYNYVTRFFPTHGYLNLTSSVKADNPFAISFATENGFVAVTSTGNLTLGQIVSPQGPTTVTLAANTQLLPSTNPDKPFSIEAEGLSITAPGSSIGTAAVPLNVKLIPGTVFTATAGINGVNVNATGLITLGAVASGSSNATYGPVTIDASAGIASNGSWVVGRSVTLTSSNGAIGTSAMAVMVSPQGAITNADSRNVSAPSIKASASGDIRIRAEGDLWVDSIASQTGSVVVKLFSPLAKLRLEPPMRGLGDELAGEAGLGPRLLFRSADGLVTTFVEGDTLSEVDMHAIASETPQLIAPRLAALHALPPPAAQAGGPPVLWRFIESMLEHTDSKALPPSVSFDRLCAEVARMRERCDVLQLPVVHGHGDLKPSNIMRRPPEATAHLLMHEALLTAGRKAVDQICFIDFELSGLHYRG
jgi:hypothetical protein